MKFCYIHLTREAQGKCTECNKWICSSDYNLVKEKVDQRQKWVEKEYYSEGKKYRDDVLETTDYFGPVVFCPDCYEKELGIFVEKPKKISDSSNFKRKKVIMCFQCAELIKSDDNYCPKCGNLTSDEKEASNNPLKGIRATKKVK